MRISLNWLSEYLPGPIDSQAAADALTHGGLPVETIDHLPDGDVVLDVEVTSNRSDCLSYQGIARELAALLDRPLAIATVERSVETPVDAVADFAAAPQVRIESNDLCPHYTARLVADVSVRASPRWLATRLSTMGTESRPVRAIQNVVDVTNYVMYEMGQPLHAFDFDKLEGGVVVVRRARSGEKLVTIDGKERSLSPDMLVIADANKPVALAGVMGGRDSEVTGATRRVLLESARFDPLNIRRTARALAMGSDSSYRFERGIDPTLPIRASQRALELMRQLADATPRGPLVQAGTSPDAPVIIFLRLQRLHQLLGVTWSTDVVMDALRRLRLRPVLRQDRIEVTAPSDRLDLRIEVDLIEEIARVVGYQKVPIRDEIGIRLAPPDPAAGTLRSMIATLCARGFFEAVTFSFVSDALADAFLPPADVHGKTPLGRADHAVRKADGALRPSILPGLLEAVRRNETVGVVDPRLFEIGSVFWHNSAGTLMEEQRLGMAGSADIRTVRGIVEHLLHNLDATRTISVTPDSHPGYAPGACGKIAWGDEHIGYLGQLDPAVAQKLSLRTLPMLAELKMTPLLAGALHTPATTALPRFPAVRRDLSFIVADATPFAKIDSLIKNLRPQWLEDLEFVTTYRGKPLETGEKSVTIALVFRSATDTLTSEAVEASVTQVVNAAQTQLGARLRA